MRRSSGYFPNNWEEYKNAPDDMFIPHTFEELMTWKIANWELPSSVACIIRETNRKTGVVQEHVYSRMYAARKKVLQLINEPDIEIAVCDHEAIHHLIPEGDS